MEKPSELKRPLVETPRRGIFTDAEQAQMITDGFDNFLTKVGLNNKNTISSGIYVFNEITKNRLQLEAAYRGSWVVGVGVDAVAEDMTRAGLDINTSEGDADIPEIQNEISELQIWNSLGLGIQWGRLYGGAIGVYQIEGQKLDTPLDISTIAQGQFKGISVYDRWQLNPSMDNLISVGPNQGLPAYYDLVAFSNVADPNKDNVTGSIKVHHSRLARFVGHPLPYYQAITEMYWGESILERVWDRLISFDNTTMNTANLVERASIRHIKIEGLRSILSAGGAAEEALLKNMNMIREFQVNEGLTLLDGKDEFGSTNYTFSGLPDTLLQFAQQLAGGFGIPLVRFFGQSPAGLNSTGEGDLRMYYDNINSLQNARLRPCCSTLLKILWRSKIGKDAPKDLKFNFTPLWQTSNLDKASMAKTNTETIALAHDNGLISAGTAVKELRASSADTGIFSSITDEDVAEAEEEQPPFPDQNEEEGSTPKPSIHAASTPLLKVEGADSKPTAYQKIKAWISRK